MDLAAVENGTIVTMHGEASESNLPLAYLLTFACYGARLHGDSRGTVDRKRNQFRARFMEENAALAGYEAAVMKHKAVQLDATEQRCVMQAIREVCDHLSWNLEAVHVRTNHVHAVVAAETDPETALHKFKSYASRALNQSQGKRSKRWSRHGSTVYLWDAGHFYDAVEYVVQRQGPQLACWVEESRWPQFAAG